jgi:RimJ/RimL family protein N-acetyltransferase
MYARLSDNTLLFIREIRADDQQRLADSLANLSEASVRKRFLGPKPTLSTAELRYLTEVDGHDHYAIVAMPAGEEEQISAVARFVRLDDDPRAAEAAIVVCDSLQGKGLGKTLARLLADTARERGVSRIHATMYSQNGPAHALMRVIAERLSDGAHDHGLQEVVAELAA